MGVYSLDRERVRYQMKNPADLKAYFVKYRQDPSIAMKSKTWFTQQMALLGNRRLNERKLFGEQDLVNRVVPGRLYMFYYDPKYKDTLPYYDRFPLVFPYKAMRDGFMGLNMHYLPYFYRVQLLTRLMQFASNSALDENTRLRYSWALIGGVSKFRMAQSCVKHYLKDHVDSQFIEIPASDWHTAMMLPVERFVGNNKSAVWSESIRV